MFSGKTYAPHVTGRSIAGTWGCLIALAALAPPAESAPLRSVLETAELPASAGQTARLGTVVLKSGDVIPWHIHRGIEMAYVVSGEVIISVADQADKVLKPGQTSIFPRGVAHSVRGSSDGDALIVVSWVTDAGAPIAIPVPTP